jgi:ribosomal protein S27AE
MKNNYANPEDLRWKCHKCDIFLSVGPATLMYMGNKIKAQLPVCPQCGFVFIAEELALGKMAEVEQILEDK